MGRLSVGVVLLAGCVTTPVSPRPVDQVSLQSRLDALPRCEAGADVGLISVKANMCTKKHCQTACCNQCSWSATFENKSAQPVPVDQARLQKLLGVTESALDCEIAAWSAELARQSVSLDGAGCVVP